MPLNPKQKEFQVTKRKQDLISSERAARKNKHFDKTTD